MQRHFNCSLKAQNTNCHYYTVKIMQLHALLGVGNSLTLPVFISIKINPRWTITSPSNVFICLLNQKKFNSNCSLNSTFVGSLQLEYLGTWSLGW